MWRITELARAFGLSRSTLLYYHRIGLLRPNARSPAGYRLYSDGDKERLTAICNFRQAGLGLEEIRKLLRSSSTQSILRRRLESISEQLRLLQSQQQLLATMINLQAGQAPPEAVDRELWVEMLRAAGMDDDAMDQWHAEFERRAPDGHHQFLLGLGIAPEHCLRIREWAQRHEDKDGR
ncbi:MAG: MerR family transcriptional regulator [Myxococcota bacterium]|jgi:DNA-binding transcriptional MerR regulator|nr:MerR family transcriptional regulator [Myxococcota bacterium]